MSKGIKLMIWATVFYGIMNLCIKYLNHIPAHEIVFFRSIITLSVTYVLLKKAKVNPLGNNKKLLILRGLAGFMGLILYIYTVQRMNIASAVTIQYLSPIFTGIFAIFLLGEKMRWLQWIFFLTAFAGVLLIKGFDPSVSNNLLATGILSAIGSGLAYNLIRKLRGQDHPLVIVFYFPLVTIPLIGPYTLTHFVWPTGFEWLLLLITGLATQLAQTFMTQSYQLEKVANVSMITYLGTIYALLMGVFIFDEQYSLMTIIGMLLIVGGIIANILYKKWTDKKQIV